MSENMHTQEPWDISLDDDQWPVVMASGKIVANVNPESFWVSGFSGGRSVVHSSK